MSTGLPINYPDVEAIVTIGTTLFASTYDEFTASHIFRSIDSGASWVETDSGSITNRLTYALAVIGTKLFAGTGNSGVYVSTDSGRIWTSTNGPTDPDVYSFVVIGMNLWPEL